MLVDELIRRQQQSGESDAKFVGRLGVRRTIWVVTRTRAKPLGLTIARAIRQRSTPVARGVSVLTSQTLSLASALDRRMIC